MGTEGSVAFQFKHCGPAYFLHRVQMKSRSWKLRLRLVLTMFLSDVDGAVEVITAVADFEAVRKRVCRPRAWCPMTPR